MTDLERLPERVTTAPATTPARCGDGAQLKPDSYPCLRFRMRSAARHVCLVIGDEGGNARAIHQMRGGHDGRWHLTVMLKPGGYRYRYYVNHGFVTTYAPPDEVDDEPIPMDGMDAVLTVSP